MVCDEFQDECDINNILKDVLRVGSTAHLSASEPQYGVQSNITYQEALNTVIEAEAQFNELPAKARKEFGNDPVKFMEYMHGEPDVQKLHDLGLLEDGEFERIVKDNQKDEIIAKESKTDKTSSE